MMEKGSTRANRAAGGEVGSGYLPARAPSDPELLPEEEEFRRRTASALWELGVRIDDLDRRAAAAGRRARLEFRELLAPLRWRSEALERRIGRFFEDDAQRWDGIRAEAFARFRREAEDTLRELTRHLRDISLIFRRRHPTPRADPPRRRQAPRLARQHPR